MTRLYFNPRCATARAVRAKLTEAGVDVEVVEYLKTPPDERELRSLVSGLDVPPGELVRKDARFRKMGLDPAAYVTEDAVVALLVEHPELLQRPLVVTDEGVLIARPATRIEAWLAST